MFLQCSLEAGTTVVTTTKYWHFGEICLFILFSQVSCILLYVCTNIFHEDMKRANREEQIHELYKKKIKKWLGSGWLKKYCFHYSKIGPRFCKLQKIGSTSFLINRQMFMFYQYYSTIHQIVKNLLFMCIYHNLTHFLFLKLILHKQRGQKLIFSPKLIIFK